MDTARKTAFITGSGRNIGRAIGLELARRGCNVIFNGSSDRAACESAVKEAETLGVRSAVAMGDVGKSEVVAAIATDILSEFGRVEILVNNAARRPHKPFLETTEQDWLDVMALDLNAAFFTTRAFVPAMIKARWGRIVNLTGMNAIQGYVEGAPISAAKHGVWGLTKALARELGPNGITVNAVSPGTIESEGKDPSSYARLIKNIPLGRLGQPGDIAAVVGFLCLDGGFVNGQMIACNGGAQT